MKKQCIIFQKLGEISVPNYPKQYQEMLADIKDGAFFQGIFSNVKKPKSNEQLGYLYSCIYPFMIEQFSEQRGGILYTIELKNGLAVPIKAETESIDIYMKHLFCFHKSIKSFNKTNASTKDIKEYIDFIDNFSIENFGYELPPSKRHGDVI